MSEMILLDGAMGTMLQAAGLPLGVRPEVFGMEHPEILEKIHKDYVDAGSRVIYANTFCANAHKLAGTGHTVKEVVTANLAIAKKAAGERARVALDIGALGDLLEPLGTMTFEEAYELFREMIVAGAEADADLIVFETMTDLAEVKAGVLAAKENCDLPVWVTMSFEETGRTFLGTLVESMASTLDAMGVDAMGINCSLGPNEIYPLIKKMREWTDKPLIVKPNAGLPDPATGKYSMTAADFATEMKPFAELGVYIMGGCCGTTPEFIAALKEQVMLPESGNAGVATAAARACATIKRGICSSTQMVAFGGIHPIGERINPTGKKRFQQALRERDMSYVMEAAVAQADAGADVLDVNVGLPGINEAEMMTQVVKAIQSVVSLPLQIDSSEPEVIEAGLRVCNGRAIINSVNAEPAKMDAIFPLMKKYGAAAVALTMDDTGLPETAEQRVAMAERIIARAAEYGIPKEDILFDCLTLTVSAAQDQVKETLKAVQMVHDRWGSHCVLGVSNISFGLPVRTKITTSFLTLAMARGLDFPIINPNQKEVMDAVYAYRTLAGDDVDCEEYIGRFAEEEQEMKRKAAEAKAKKASGAAGLSEKAGAGEKAGTDRASKDGTGSADSDINNAVLKGLKEETARLTAKYLETMSELDVINQKLIPALDLVGAKYEKQEIFIPQLIKAANAACAGFDLVRDRIREKGGESVNKGKILIATVEGDIHDIGKNIVKVVLENYGYEVIDLGRDVPAETIVETAIRENIYLIGLSALMTTTVESMRKTIVALRESGHPCKIMVGGAVLTPEYAEEIGADYYSADAKESVDIAKKVLG